MGLKDLFTMGKVLVKTAKSVRSNRNDAAELALRPMPEVLEAWLASSNRLPELWSATTRLPATEDQLVVTERRLGATLPPDIRDFYRLTDGLEAKTGTDPFPSPFVGVGALIPCGQHRPPLSQQCDAQWKEWGEEQEEPRALRIFPNNMRNILTDEDEGEISFAEADGWIALEIPRDAGCLAFELRGGLKYPAGTVFEVENLQATRYGNLREWFAYRATMLNFAGGAG